MTGERVESRALFKRLHPGAGLLSMLILAVLLLVLPWGAGFAAGVLIALVVIILSGVPATRLAAPVLLLGWMFVLTILIHGFSSSGHLLWEMPGTGWTLTEEGVAKGALLSGRIALAVLALGTVALSLDTFAVLHALEVFFRPLKRTGLDLSGAVLTMGLALRFIPTLYDEGRQLRKALLTRGWTHGRGPVRRVTAWVPMLIPLVAGGMRRSEDLAEALVLRGYDPGADRTSMYDRRWTVADYFACIVVSVPLAVQLLVG